MPTSLGHFYLRSAHLELRLLESVFDGSALASVVSLVIFTTIGFAATFVDQASISVPPNPADGLNVVDPALKWAQQVERDAKVVFAAVVVATEQASIFAVGGVDEPEASIAPADLLEGLPLDLLLAEDRLCQLSVRDLSKTC